MSYHLHFIFVFDRKIQFTALIRVGILFDRIAPGAGRSSALISIVRIVYEHACVPDVPLSSFVTEKCMSSKKNGGIAAASSLPIVPSIIMYNIMFSVVQNTRGPFHYANHYIVLAYTNILSLLRSSSYTVYSLCILYIYIYIKIQICTINVCFVILMKQDVKNLFNSVRNHVPRIHLSARVHT